MNVPRRPAIFGIAIVAAIVLAATFLYEHNSAAGSVSQQAVSNSEPPSTTSLQPYAKSTSTPATSTALSNVPSTSVRNFQKIELAVPHSGPTPLTVTATFDGCTAAQEVNWGDGTYGVASCGADIPSSNHHAVTLQHTYISPGIYSITSSGYTPQAISVVISSSTPVISAIEPNHTGIKSTIHITGANFDPVGGYVGNGWITTPHSRLFIEDGEGRSQVLWFGNEPDDDSTLATSSITLELPSGLPCVATPKNELCASGAYVLVPGQYVLYLIADGRGQSNIVPLTLIK